MSTLTGAHDFDQPSEWVARWSHAIAPRGTVLDLACGSGRHSRFLAALGFQVCAVDRNTLALEALRRVTGVTVRQADLESDPWPLDDLQFDAIVVTNYLHRPLFLRIIEALKPGGSLIYETFAAGNERFGKPSNPDFLLRPGELLDVARNRLRVVAYEELEVAPPRPACIQRMCAVALPAQV